MGGARINDDEIATAAKLAGRKTGVTHNQLAGDLAITTLRAAAILGRTRGLRVERTPNGKAARLLTYFTKDSHAAWSQKGRKGKASRKK